MTWAVNIENVSFKRGERWIFKDLYMQIPQGKVVAVMGPSGTGKTTLLNLMGGQLKPLSGKVEVFGENVNKISRKKLYDLRKRIGVLFQSGALLTDLTVMENVAFPLRQHTQLTAADIRDLVIMKLQAVGLRGALDLMPSELSGGMARRVALARAIALDPDMIFYDEPFVGQDPIMMGVLLKLIRELNDALGLTSIVVTHDVNEMLEIADYVFILSAGKVIAQGTPEEMKNADDMSVKQFIQGLPDGPVPFHYPARDYHQELLEAK